MKTRIIVLSAIAAVNCFAFSLNDLADVAKKEQEQFVEQAKKVQSNIQASQTTQVEQASQIAQVEQASQTTQVEQAKKVQSNIQASPSSQTDKVNQSNQSANKSLQNELQDDAKTEEILKILKDLDSQCEQFNGWKSTEIYNEFDYQGRGLNNEQFFLQYYKPELIEVQYNAITEATLRKNLEKIRSDLKTTLKSKLTNQEMLTFYNNHRKVTGKKDILSTVINNSQPVDIVIFACDDDYIYRSNKHKQDDLKKLYKRAVKDYEPIQIKANLKNIKIDDFIIIYDLEQDYYTDRFRVKDQVDTNKIILMPRAVSLLYSDLNFDSKVHILSNTKKYYSQIKEFILKSLNDEPEKLSVYFKDDRGSSSSNDYKYLSNYQLFLSDEFVTELDYIEKYLYLKKIDNPTKKVDLDEIIRNNHLENVISDNNYSGRDGMMSYLGTNQYEMLLKIRNEMPSLKEQILSALKNDQNELSKMKEFYSNDNSIVKMCEDFDFIMTNKYLNKINFFIKDYEQIEANTNEYNKKIEQKTLQNRKNYDAKYKPQYEKWKQNISSFRKTLRPGTKLEGGTLVINAEGNLILVQNKFGKQIYVNRNEIIPPLPSEFGNFFLEDYGRGERFK